jgi:hypothetical protein
MHPRVCVCVGGRLTSGVGAGTGSASAALALLAALRARLAAAFCCLLKGVAAGRGQLEAAGAPAGTVLVMQVAALAGAALTSSAGAGACRATSAGFCSERRGGQGRVVRRGFGV